MNFVDHVKLMEAAESVRAEALVSPHAAPPSTARADFTCANCAKVGGVPETRWTSLPADAIRCPRCGHKRGFKRLFDAVAVSTVGHRQAQFIDPRMTVAYDQHSAQKQGAQAAERAGIRGMGIPAATALAAIDPVARSDSRNYTMPMVGARRVAPRWSR